MPAEPRRRLLLAPTGRGWWIIAAGLAIGLALFLALWLSQRAGPPEPYRADEQAPAAAAPVFKPLPAPPPPGLAGEPIPAGPAAGARLEEPERRAPPPSAADPRMAGDGGEPAPDVPSPTAASATSAPVPVSSPQPEYPRRSLRRGESGEVLLRIHVDSRGVPARVDVASSSGSRDLDRAAQRAVRRWRFRPATRDGMAVGGEVTVPIRFDAGG